MNEKQVKKDVVAEQYFYGRIFYCPSCHKHLGANYDDLSDVNYCSKCGQLLSWSKRFLRGNYGA